MLPRLFLFSNIKIYFNRKYGLPIYKIIGVAALFLFIDPNQYTLTPNPNHYESTRCFNYQPAH